MIKKIISKSKKMGRLKDDSARLLYFMMLPHSDIEGRLEGDSLLVRSTVMPYFHDWDDEKIQQCLELLHEVGLIILYTIEEDQYVQITRFEDFQTIRKDRESASDIPKPPKPKPNSNPTPTLSKVKLSKDKLIKPAKKPVDNSAKAEPSADFKEIIHRVHKEKKVNFSIRYSYLSGNLFLNHSWASNIFL